MSRWHLAGGFTIAFAHLGVLGALIGWVGGSRAYGTGLHTLFEDHLPAVMVATLVALVVAAITARFATSPGEVGLVLASVVVADVLAALFVIVGIGEITFADLPRVLLTETAAGTQLASALVGAVLGYGTRQVGLGLVSRR